jgi:hypothetical protein
MLLPHPGAFNDDALPEERGLFVIARLCSVALLTMVAAWPVVPTLLLTQTLMWGLALPVALEDQDYDFNTLTGQARRHVVHAAVVAVAYVALTLHASEPAILVVGVLLELLLLPLPFSPLAALVTALPVKPLLHGLLIAGWLYGFFLPTRIPTLAVFALYVLEGITLIWEIAPWPL